MVKKEKKICHTLLPHSLFLVPRLLENLRKSFYDDFLELVLLSPGLLDGLDAWLGFSALAWIHHCFSGLSSDVKMREEKRRGVVRVCGSPFFVPLDTSLPCLFWVVFAILRIEEAPI
jgi:hypothetical protein